MIGDAHYFGNGEIGVLGYSDGARGAQWNCWYNQDTHLASFGINLEGIEGDDGWPLTYLLEREKRRPLIFGALERLPQPDAVELRLWRDVWIAGRKHRSLGDEIAPMPIRASALTNSGWTRALRAAWKRTDQANQGRGYGREDIVLWVARTSQTQAKVCPHFQCKTWLWAQEPATVLLREKAMLAARRRLAPLYEFVRARSMGPQ